MESIFQVAELIRRVGRVDGRKRLQKIVYLLQQKGFPFCEDFEYGHFGPYSRTLAAELDVLKSNELIKEMVQGNNYGEEYSYEPTDLLNSLAKENPELWTLGVGDIDRVLSILNVKQTPVLEVASARLFLEKSGYSGEGLETKLKAWKPNLERNFHEAERLLNELGLEA